MSATERPWLRGEYPRELLYVMLSPEDAETAVMAVNAFDALLAVAKAAGSANDNPGWVFEMSDALTALDAAHPDWREWA